MKDPIDARPSSGGLPGVLRLTAVITIICLALLGALVVIGVFPRDSLAAYGSRILILAGIGAAAFIGIAVLVSRGRRSS